MIGTEESIKQQAIQNGRILAGDCEYLNCYTCGLNKCNKENKMELKPVPQKPERKGMRKAYYDANKEQIITEIKLNGLKPTLKRWGISQATWATPGGLNDRWQAGIPWPYKQQRKPTNDPVVSEQGEAPGEPETPRVTENIPENIPEPGAVEDKFNPYHVGIIVSTQVLPIFPAFDNAWNDPVKLAWFEGYVCLVENTRVPAGAANG